MWENGHWTERSQQMHPYAYAVQQQLRFTAFTQRAWVWVTNELSLWEWVFNCPFILTRIIYFMTDRLMFQLCFNYFLSLLNLCTRCLHHLNAKFCVTHFLQLSIWHSNECTDPPTSGMRSSQHTTHWWDTTRHSKRTS